MFCIVEIENNKPTFSFFKRLFNKSTYELKTVNVLFAAPFYYLKISRGECGENYEKLEKILGRCSKFIINGGESVIEDNEYVRNYSPTVFPSIMILNSSEAIIAHSGIDRCKLSLSVYDEKALFTSYVEKFIMIAAEIRIFTGNQARYEETAKALYEKYGASIMIFESEKFDCKSDFTIVTGNEPQIIQNTGEKMKLFKGDYFDTGIELEKIRPLNVEKILFASALYELCGAKSLAGLKYITFTTTELS